MKALVIADPLSALNPKGDTSLALAREGLNRHWEVVWATPDQLFFRSPELWVEGSSLVRESEAELLPKSIKNGKFPLTEFDVVFIRKDPPFDSHYQKLCWLLCLIEDRVLAINRPSLLLRHHEKMIPFDAVAKGYLQASDIVPTYIGQPKGAIEFVQQQGWDPIISKPFLGYGGREITKVSAEAFQNQNALGEDSLVQPYLPEVTKSGDRRVFFLEGRVLCEFARIPEQGNFVSNLAQGGSAEQRPLSDKEKSVLENLGNYLKEIGIVLAGADVIDDKISEVNVTSPTGLMSLLELEGTDYADKILDVIEKKVHQNRV